MAEGLHDICMILRTFNEAFEEAGFVAPPRVFERRRAWRCYADSKRIDIAFGLRDGKEYVDFSAWSKFSGNLRGRIYEDGFRESLEPEQEVIIFDPALPGDAELAEERMREHNERVERGQRAAGFPVEHDHSMFKGALARAARELTAEWPEMLSGPRREDRFRRVLRRALEFEVGNLIALEKRVNLGEDWPNEPPRLLGGVDLLVHYMPGDERWRYLAELKWSAEAHNKVFECLWDALKMLAASRIPYVEAAYVIAGARELDWNRPAPCAELFADGEWDVRELLTRYPSEWRFLVETSGPPPRRLPQVFRSTLIAEEQVEDFVIKAVAISCKDWFGEHVEFDDGFLRGGAV